MRTERLFSECWRQSNGGWQRLILEAILLTGLLLPTHSLATEPVLLAHYKFNGNGEDAVGNSSPMDLDGVSITNGTLALPEDWDYTAQAQITGFSYSSFTVAFDFKPYDFILPHSTILSGGPWYRWIGFENDTDGHLSLTLNNWRITYYFTNVLTMNQWHTLICSVNVPAQTIITVLDGERLPDIILEDFIFDVIGTTFEQGDKAFTFRNYGFISAFYGQADNLRVYDRALNGAEIQSLLSPRLAITQAGSSAQISWPADLTGYSVETTTSLQTPVTWVTDSRPPLLIGDQKVLVDQLATGTRFYRLRRL